MWSIVFVKVLWLLFMLFLSLKRGRLETLFDNHCGSFFSFLWSETRFSSVILTRTAAAVPQPHINHVARKWSFILNPQQFSLLHSPHLWHTSLNCFVSLNAVPSACSYVWKVASFRRFTLALVAVSNLLVSGAFAVIVFVLKATPFCICYR